MKLAMAVLFSLTAAAAWAQGPVLDGSVSAGEYAYSETKNGMTVGAALSSDKATLFLSISAKTQGWVAVGAGSSLMDGAYMILGFVEGGKETVQFELGKGRSHATTGSDGVKAKVSESGDSTTLEVSMPAAPYLKDGQVQLILAIGATDNTKARHSARAQVTAKL